MHIVTGREKHIVSSCLLIVWRQFQSVDYDVDSSYLGPLSCASLASGEQEQGVGKAASSPRIVLGFCELCQAWRSRGLGELWAVGDWSTRRGVEERLKLCVLWYPEDWGVGWEVNISLWWQLRRRKIWRTLLVWYPCSKQIVNGSGVGLEDLLFKEGRYCG